MPRVIGLAGRARAGKNTLAAALIPHGYEVVSFADPLREMALALDPFIDGEVRLSDLVHRLGWDYAKVSYPEVRRILQSLGTDVVRGVDPEYWVKQMQAKICDSDKRFVVADCRFQNEVEVIRLCGGLVVEIDRPSLGPLVDTHVSELGVQADWVILNSGSPEDLYHEFMAKIRDL